MQAQDIKWLCAYFVTVVLTTCNEQCRQEEIERVSRASRGVDDNMSQDSAASLQAPKFMAFPGTCRRQGSKTQGLSQVSRIYGL